LQPLLVQEFDDDDAGDDEDGDKNVDGLPYSSIYPHLNSQ